jgi:hypothetical protein
MLTTDRNLLFGILALQMDFISRDALIAAMHAWVLDKAKPLGQILVDQGHLNPQHHSLLDAMVQAHIKAHAAVAQPLGGLLGCWTVFSLATCLGSQYDQPRNRLITSP